MKKSFFYLLLLCLSMTFFSCKKGEVGDPGAEGPAGPQGPAGPLGVAGNANVTQYNFGAHNFATSSQKILNVAIAAADMNRSVWLVYIVRASGNVYPIPGFGVNGTSEYRIYMYHSAPNAVISIQRATGPGEEYSSIRVIRIQATNVVNGRNASVEPGIDFNDYYAVCDYYGLPY